MKLEDAIAVLDKSVPDPGKGLPDEVFYYISRTTPLINVDLLIKNENGQTLLSWRDDRYCGKGWHIPGGIIRYRENFETRIKKVALSEIGIEVEYDKIPLAVNELIHKEQRDRGHFISILYKCYLPASFVPDNKGLCSEDGGFIKWHDRCPGNLLQVQELYRIYI